MSIPSGYSKVLTKTGASVGPGSKFYVVVEIWAKDTGTSWDTYIKRYVHVDAGTNGFGGTNLTLGWSPGSVSISGTGNYAEYDYKWKNFTYGGSEPVQAKDAIAYYTSGSGNYYESYVSFTYTAPVKYSVAYNANGGSGSMATDYVTYGSNYTTKANTFSRTGHTWIGWNEAANGSGVDWTDRVGKAWTWTYTKSITLYAQWRANTYTISYNANGGSGAPASHSYTYASSGATYLSSTIPTRPGYTFLGWSLSSSATSASYSAGQAWGLSNASNYTLYAVWQLATASYNLNILLPDGSEPYTTGAAGTVEVSVNGGEWTRMYNEPQGSYPIGTTFSYRNFSPATGLVLSDVTGVTTANGVWNATLTSDGLTVNFKTIYATYSVSYNANGGSGAPGNQTKTHGTNLTLSVTEPTYTGYFFKGWNTKADGSGVSYSPGATYTGNEALTLYAQWQVATLIGMQITYPGDYVISNDQSGAVFSDITIPFTLVRADGNTNLNFIYQVYYTFNNILAGEAQYTIPGGTNTGSFTLSAEHIKNYIADTGNISSIDLVIKAYTGEVSDDTLSEYNYSITIDGYSKPIIKKLINYRNADGSAYVKAIISYPKSYNVSNCIPVLYFNDAELNVSPIATVDGNNTDILNSENLGIYVYNLSSSEANGSGDIKIYYSDGLFETSKVRLLAATVDEQVIRISKDGIIRAFEFIEEDTSIISLSRNGAITAFEFIEGETSVISLSSNGTVTALELIEI